MSEAIILFIILFPLSLWSYFRPEDALLFGKRWQYSEEPELSETVIVLTKVFSVFIMVVVTVVLIFTILAKFH